MGAWILACVIVAGFAIIYIPVTFLNACILWCLWQWFALPVGLPALSVWQLAGISLLFNTFCPYVPPPSDTEGRQNFYCCLMMKPLVALFLGWVLHFFVR